MENAISTIISLSAPRDTRSLRANVIALLLFFSAALIGFIAWNTWHERSLKLRETETVVINMTKAVSQHAQDTIEGADTLVAGVVELLESQPKNMDLDRLHAFLKVSVAQRPSLHGVFVYDRDGKWVINSLLDSPKNLNNSDRQYFQYHKAFANRGPFLGPSIISRSTGDRIITISRRFQDVNGAFAGVVLATVSVDYFKAFYESFDIGEKGAIFLATDTGDLLTRRPFNKNLLANIRKGPVFQEYLSRGPAGTAMLVAPSDKIERLYGYRHLDSYPGIVAVGLSKDEILASWQAVTLRTWTLTIAFLVLFWLFGLRLLNQLKVQERQQAELLKAKQEVEAMNSELAALALQDGLTGLANRRKFDAVIDVEFSRAIRDSSPLSIIMIDVDHFKQYNDHYGHLKGDECLRQVAHALDAVSVRPSDLVARYGGEEFSVILPSTDVEGAGLVAERLLKAIADMEIPHERSGLGIVTVSLGVACMVPMREKAAADLVHAADNALYMAKSKGRNQVCSMQL